MIFFFIPGFMYIGVQVIRAMFKDDFLMTKRGKKKLEKFREEQEKIHQAYITAGGESAESDAAEDAPEDETPGEDTGSEGGDE